MAEGAGNEIGLVQGKTTGGMSFFDKSRSVRIIIVAAFLFSLFVFIHFREVRVNIPELNSIAPGYVVAQIDFDFFDDEATIILQQEAVRDIGKIYKLADTFTRQRRTEFENYLMYNKDWRRRDRQSTFDEMYAGMDRLESALLQLRLADPRTFRKMEQVGLDTQDYLIFTPLEVQGEVQLPEVLWQRVRETAFADSGLEPATIDSIFSYFQNKAWKLEEDTNAERILRREVQSHVPDKYTHVSAGKRIIDQGEKVTPRHIAMLQAMKKTLTESRNLWHLETLAGSILMSMLLTTLGFIFLRSVHPDVLKSNQRLFLLVTVIVITLVASKIFEFVVVTSGSRIGDAVRFPLFAPFVAIMLCSLLYADIAAFVAIFVTIMLWMTLAIERGGFLITNMAAAFVVILNHKVLWRRKQIFLVCGQAWLVCAVAIIALQLCVEKLWQMSTLADLVSSALFMLGTAIIAAGLLPLLESAFDIMTDSTLMEYMDPNGELLRRLAIEAPGTYQHSVVVGNLAESAALAIGANGLFCRVAALYHDIGKLATPQYFSENQQGGMNIHQLLTPKESAQVIVAHVREGVALARKSGLPEPFIDIIKEHHGTTLAYFFYRKQRELVGEKASIDETDYRYHGPKPRTKESAIIMIADCLEAASRSLEEVTEEKLTELTDTLIREKTEDGQFDGCLLTFEELGIVKRSMVKTLMAAAHARVKYPKREVEQKAG